MKIIICDSNTKFTKFWINDLFTNKLVKCPECVFDSVIIKHRILFDMKYDGVNAQIFINKETGLIEGRRER